MAKRIGVITQGSWGDVLPFVPIARAIESRGFTVRVAAPTAFVARLRSLGISAIPGSPIVRANALDQFERSLASDLTGRSAFDAYWTGIVVEGARRMLPKVIQLASASDFLLLHGNSLSGFVAASQLGLPHACLSMSAAAVRSAAYAPGPALQESKVPEQTFAPASVAANDRSWTLEESWLARTVDRATNELLKQFDVAPIRAAPLAIANAAPAHIVAGESAFIPHCADWPSNVVLTGYPYFDGIAQLDSALNRFLDEGDAPALVTFGTAVGSAMTQRRAEIVDQLRAHDLRVVVLGVETSRQDDQVFHASFAPISQVLPYCRLVVHHGGAGTTHAAVLADLPSLVVPQFADQPLNAARLAYLGAGVSVPPMSLSPSAISLAIEKCLELRTANSLAQNYMSEPAEAIADLVDWMTS